MLKKDNDLSRNNLFLLISLIILIFIIPVFNAYSFVKILYDVFISVLLFLMVFTIKTYRKKLIIVAIISIILKWIPDKSDQSIIQVISQAWNILFIIFIVVMLIVQVAKSKKVSTNVILESINGYLLLGFVGAIFVILVDIFQNGAFNVSTSGAMHFSDAIYYSFVTITTLGYGDITPMSDLARSVSIFFSVVGQLYLTILIAMLVGKFLVQYQAKE